MHIQEDSPDVSEVGHPKPRRFNSDTAETVLGLSPLTLHLPCTRLPLQIQPLIRRRTFDGERCVWARRKGFRGEIRRRDGAAGMPDLFVWDRRRRGGEGAEVSTCFPRGLFG
ncbi:unnamed protein product [Cuscuta epithymum]|uniref:Uncharacterized protein n=1 Tax=Cuscuta epithymum TaxID=186058 RepID=A0AAV0F0D9_9ASTE|nr:unnamed protein product [Cuscuta epithymum]